MARFLRIPHPRTPSAPLMMAAILLATSPVHALRTNGNDWPINLGITGALGDLKPDAPKTIVVTEVRPGTPAAGKLEAGDRITGVNGRKFRDAHKFGYGMDKFGYEGPLMDFGNALEDSQGPKLNGEFTMHVERDGKKMDVALQLPMKYGQFAKTYPFDCGKTDAMLDELYVFLVETQGENGSWSGRPHLNTFAALALLSSGRQKFQKPVDRAMRHMAGSTNATISYGGLDCWKYGLYGFALAEYYLAAKEEWVLPELEEINEWLAQAQFAEHYKGGMGAGGWGHRPQLRPEGNGYGPICVITAQAMAAWALMEPCGIQIDRRKFDLAHEFIMKGTNNIGYVWYKDGNGGDNKYADMGRTGASAMAHALAPYKDAKYARQARANAKCIGKNFNTFFDTHGSPILGTAWTALGAATDPKAFRTVMDEHKWFFNLSQCPDGTFYYMPNRDGNRQDYGADNQLPGSAMTALILSIKHQSLRCMQAAR